MKYRKKPVVIDAVQFFDNKPDFSLPDGVCACMDVAHDSGAQGRPHIHTLEGVMLVSSGDFIITGVKGERYPCKPDIFEATYEPADEKPEPKCGECGGSGSVSCPGHAPGCGGRCEPRCPVEEQHPCPVCSGGKP